MVSYYDFVLAFIPVSLLGVPGLLSGVHGLDLTVAVPLGAALSAALIGHAMFVRAPGATPERRPTTTDARAPAAD